MYPGLVYLTEIFYATRVHGDGRPPGDARCYSKDASLATGRAEYTGNHTRDDGEYAEISC